MKGKITAVLLAFVLLLALIPAGPALADDEGLYVKDTAPTAVETTVGAQYELDLTTVFADSDGHDLTYAMTGAEINQHTKIKDGVFYFSVQNADTYYITLTATCVEHGTVSHSITFHVEAANHGLPEQYGYDETPADSVTVYFTLSSDGVPLLADDGTALAHLEITVPYFDLALYGLEDYYRCHTANGEGPYIDAEVVERPTGLHLYLYVLERYYMGLPEEECGLGTSDVLEYCVSKEIFNIYEQAAYITNGLMAITPSQSPTSLYMSNFWGHNENLMYYRNHVFPYMSAGWGATSDYILLSDGDTWDVALFSNWNFWNDGGKFVRFDKDTYTVRAGEDLTVTTSAYGTTFESSNFSPIAAERMEYKILDASGSIIVDDFEPTGNQAVITVPTEPGVYTLVGVDCDGNTPDARLAPPTAKLIVTAAPAVSYGDPDGTGVVDVTDVQLVCKYILGKTTFDAAAVLAADVDANGTVDVTDVQLICKFILGKITEFPAQG